MTRSRTRLLIWLVAFLILYTVAAWTVDDYACVSSMVVSIDSPPVINPMYCE